MSSEVEARGNAGAALLGVLLLLLFAFLLISQNDPDGGPVQPVPSVSAS